MLSNPLFSVLIANYNDGKYISEAIESVKTQTYTNWEIIIVDDGSSDNSMSVIKGLNDPRIHAYQNDMNRGCGYTKRRCVELAHGEICGFVDADDCIAENALETMVDAHIKNPACSLIYSQFYYSDEKLNIISVSEHQCAIPDGESFLTCKKQGAISHFVTFKKKSYLNTDGIDTSMRIAEDIDLYFKLEEVGKVLFIPLPLYYYRINTGNNTSLGEKNYGKTLGWEIIAKSAACRRRGLPIDQYSFSNLEQTISNIRNSAFQQGSDNTRKTKAYQLGSSLLIPLKWVKQKAKKSQS